MVLNKFPTAGGVIENATTWINENFAVGWSLSLRNLIRQLQDRTIILSPGEYAEAYTTAAGRLGTVDTTNTTATFDTDKYYCDDGTEKIIKQYIPFSSIPSEDISSFITEGLSVGTSGEITYKLKNEVLSFTGPFVLIEASSFGTSINNNSSLSFDCKLYMNNPYVLVYCTTGTDEEKRSKIYNALFSRESSFNSFGGSSFIDNFTNIKGLYTSVSRDVGKNFYVFHARSTSGNSDITITFNNTEDNTDCSSWSSVARSNQSAPFDGGMAYWQMPVGTTLNSVSTQNTTIDERGVDTTSDELDNPSNARVGVTDTSGSNSSAEKGATVLLLCFGTISTTPGGGGTKAEIEYPNIVPDLETNPSVTTSITAAETSSYNFRELGNSAGLNATPHILEITLSPDQSDITPELKGVGLLL